MIQLLTEICISLYVVSLTIILIYSSQGFILLYLSKKYGEKLYSQLDQSSLSETVTVQLPIYNEKFVIERLINSVCELDYPKDLLEIQVLDDSTDETTEIARKIIGRKREEGFNIELIHRSDRTGFKAGALAEGIKKASGKFIAIFDADFIPRKDFLKQLLSYFTSENIGMVQSRWEYINEGDSLFTSVQAYGLNAHFVVEQSVRSYSGMLITFNGTAGVLRKKCIEDSGGWQGDTITEDLDLSYRAQLKGWKFIYLNNYTTPSELPDDISSLKAQQFRWTKGAVETAKKLLGRIFKSEIEARIKLQAVFHLTNNFVFPFIFIVGVLNIPMIFIKATGNFDLFFNLMSVFIIALISSFLLYFYAQAKSRLSWFKKTFYFPIFLAASMGLSINNTKAVIEGLLNRKSDFERTPKFSSDSLLNKAVYRSKQNIIVIIIELLMVLFTFAGIYFSVLHKDFGAFIFNFLFFIGFGVVSVLSLRNRIFKRN